MIKRVFPILVLSVFSSTLGVGIIAPLLPLYAKDLGATGIWLGVIFASFSISRLIVMPIFGRLSDRYGRKVFITTGVLAAAIISLGYIWADNLFQLTLIRLLHGAATGMILPIAQAYVGDIAPEGEEGKWMGYFNAAFFTGFGFGPLMGGTLTEHFGMTSAFATMSSLNLLAFLLAVPFLPEIKSQKKATRPHSSFKEMVTSDTLKGIFGFRLGFSLGRGSFATFLPIFASIFLGLSPTLVGIVLAVNILLMSLLQLSAGHIADRYSRRGLVIIGGLINFIYLAFIPLASSFWYLLAISAIGGLGAAFSMPAASAMAVGEGRKFGMGSTMALMSMFFSLGMVIGPILSGVIADMVNINAVFYFAAAMGLAGTTFFAWATR